MPREIIQHLLLGAIAWTSLEGRDISAPPSKAVYGTSSWTRHSVSDALLWTLAGTYSENEKKALGTS